MEFTFFLCMQQPTVPKPFNLGLDKRVTERKKFRKDLEKRQNDVDKREQIAKAKQDEEDKKELKEFRRSLDFKVGSLMHNYCLLDNLMLKCS